MDNLDHLNLSRVNLLMSSIGRVPRLESLALHPNWREGLTEIGTSLASYAEKSPFCQVRDIYHNDSKPPLPSLNRLPVVPLCLLR